MRTGRLLTYAAVAGIGLYGVCAMLLFIVFVYGYRFTLVEADAGVGVVLLWDTALCLLFFLQHSAMVRQGFRRRLSGVIAEHYLGLVYTAASATVLLALVLFWQYSQLELLRWQGWPRLMVQSLFVAALAGMTWGLVALGTADLFGVRRALGRDGDRQPNDKALTCAGPYGWVRHPLYFFTLVLIWATPVLSADRLLFNGLFTVWIVLGTRLEERDLVAGFGESYRTYQRTVPMLIPWKLFVRPKSRDER
jgi:protein-S-isoprenylcysteine O-methyltransferase Ste14